MVPIRFFIQMIPAKERQERAFDGRVRRVRGGTARGDHVHTALQKRDLSAEGLPQAALDAVARNGVPHFFAHGEPDKEFRSLDKGHGHLAARAAPALSVHIAELSVLAQAKLFLHIFPAFMKEYWLRFRACTCPERMRIPRPPALSN